MKRCLRAPIVVIAVVVAAVAALAAVSAVDDQPTSTGAGSQTGRERRSGEPVPTFRARELSNGTVDLADYAGRPIVINFWRSNCHPCRQEFPLLRDLSQHEGVAVIGVNVQDLGMDARSFVRKEGARWPQAIDPDARIARLFRVNGLPQTFFVTQTGTTALRIFGAMSEADTRDGLHAIRSQTSSLSAPR